ncbi:MAG: glycosyltransferase [Desulforhopalus sp.]|nr:glycosyltransferase [Desulforhopalus sp.]
MAPLLRVLSYLSRTKKTGEVLPNLSISVIVSAYNEEKNIAEKIENLRQALQHIKVDYEVIIGADGSTDRTVEIAEVALRAIGDPRWRMVTFANEGKCQTLNKLVALARGEVIISTDADILLPENAINLVVEAFRFDSQLGCLSCVPNFYGQEIGNQKYYWNLEDQIRRAESSLGKLIVVTGMLYAFRKELYTKIPEGVMADDLWIPLNILLQGSKSMQVDTLLVSSEKTDEETEILRRKRVIVGGMDVVKRLLPRLVKSPSLFVLVFAHKVNRWALPLWIVMIMAAFAWIWPWFAAVYLGVAALLIVGLGKKRFSRLVFAVFSPMLAAMEIIRGEDFSRWEPIRKH